MSRFPRRLVSLVQVLAECPTGRETGFAPAAGLAHDRARALDPRSIARFWLDCYPSRLGQRGLRTAPLPVFARRRAVANRPNSAFNISRFPLDSWHITTLHRGSHTCVNPFWFSLLSALPFWPAACATASMPTARRLAWPVAQPLARPRTTISRNRPSQAVSWALSRATRAPATDPTRRANCGAASILGTIGAPAPVVLFLSPSSRPA